MDPNAFTSAFRRHDPAEHRQKIADVLAAGFLYRFASRQLVAKLSADQVVMPVAVAEALAMVEQWVNDLLPDRPGS
jgi:hypothetical protein